MANAKFPRRPEDITPGWINHALRRAGAVQHSTAVAVDVKPIKGGSGGSVFRVRPAYDRIERAAPQSLVAKLPPRQGTAAALIMTELGMCATEAAFYGEFAGQADVQTPLCYFNAFDVETGAGMLLLEDLAGMRIGRPGASLDDARSALLTLARLHASMWNSPLLRRNERLDWRRRAAPYTRRIRAWLDLVLRGSPGVIDVRAVRIIEAALERTPRAVALLSRPPVTLVHGDPWMNNFAFHDEHASPAVLFDWQLAARMRPGFDVACFIDIVPEFHAFDDDDVWLEETSRLIRGYHAALTGLGVTDYSLDQLLYDRTLALAYTIPAGLWSQMTLQGIIGPEFERNVQEWSRRLVERASRLDAATLQQ